MDPHTNHLPFEKLQKKFAGDILLDTTQRALYSTDASIYEEVPAAVAIPKNESDIRELIQFANETGVGLIPRAAGTSLAGQVVGSGIVVDISRHFTRIVEVNQQESWVRVQPGVIRDELNMTLADFGLYFAPETSTSNRAMIGGMLGNNSCGANSIVYGDTREHVIEVTGFMSDGSRAQFGPLSNREFDAQCDRVDKTLTTKIYRQIHNILSSPENQREIHSQFPKSSIRRRNMGYAIDLLLDCQPFGGEKQFNLARLLAGSEGTLFFATEIKLNCVPLPPKQSALLCVHFKSLNDALKANRIGMQHQPDRCEIIDHFVIEGARRNLEQEKNAAFISGDPEALLMIEFRDKDQEQALHRASQLARELRQNDLGYEFPILSGTSAQQAWSLRRSGLGVVNNLVSDGTKPVTVIEDSAVDIEDLAEFITEVDELCDHFETSCVHYGHAGAGELHLRPTLNLKEPADRVKLRQIATKVAGIVKKYRGSLSGEHGDGRLRAEFLEQMLGTACFGWIQQIKQAWDPNDIFNPGKIVGFPPMDVALRQKVEMPAQPTTHFRFAAGSLLGAAEMCSGSGDCRKTHISGGTMCPSYMATRNEKDSTRGRANILRQFLSGPSDKLLNQVDDDDVKNVMDLCLSCKACKSECPSNVDMAKIKAEFMQKYHDTHGTSLKNRMLASFETWSRRASAASGMVNFFSSYALTSQVVKQILGIHSKRSIPKLAPMTLRKWFNSREPQPSKNPNGKVVFFCDEFTNYIDVAVGKSAIELLEILGYEVLIPEHVESGRSAISRGMLRSARSYAETNVRALATVVSEVGTLVGIEPSALLTIRDEYPDLVCDELVADARMLATKTLLIDEFLSDEVDSGRIRTDQFDASPGNVLLHGHCHQKALSSMEPTRNILELPDKLQVTVLESGCCGMAGFFGYEKNHFDLSMQIGELVLFPALREAPPDTLIAATGTSCRHQIFDGTKRLAYHPVEILRNMLNPIDRV